MKRILTMASKKVPEHFRFSSDIDNAYIKLTIGRTQRFFKINKVETENVAELLYEIAKNSTSSKMYLTFCKQSLVSPFFRFILIKVFLMLGSSEMFNMSQELSEADIKRLTDGRHIKENAQEHVSDMGMTIICNH